MGLFTKKQAPTVAFDASTAVMASDVSNLQANLRKVADHAGWSDRSQPSPALQATLRHGTSTYGHQTAGVWVGKTVVGYLGTPAYRGVSDLIDPHKGLPVSVRLRTSGGGYLVDVSLPQLT